MTDLARPAGLRRELGPLGVTFLAFSGLSPAASVYLFGAGVIHIGGTGAIGAVLLGGAVAALLGLLFGELAAAFPRAGGVYPAFVAILGPRLAFPYIVLMLTVAVSNTAFSLLGLADYVRVLAPELPELPVAIAALVAAGVIAVLSIRTGALVTGAFLAVEMAALTVLTGCAFLHPWHAPLAAALHPMLPVDGRMEAAPASSFALAVVTSVFTCGGAVWALYFAEEMIEPHLRIGRIVNWISPLAAATIALPLVVALLAAPDWIAMISSDAPLATFLDQTGGPVFNAVVAIIMGYSRLIYSTARDGLWPPVAGAPMAFISRRFGSPLNATLVLCLASGAAMLGGERMLLVLSSNENVLEYTLLGLAIIVGRRTGRTGRHHRVRPYPWIAAGSILTGIALAVADWFDVDAGRPSLVVLTAIIAFSVLYYPRVRQRLTAPERPG